MITYHSLRGTSTNPSTCPSNKSSLSLVCVVVVGIGVCVVGGVVVAIVVVVVVVVVVFVGFIIIFWCFCLPFVYFSSNPLMCMFQEIMILCEILMLMMPS